MDTLLIVEDEKVIRHGIATMAQRTSVPIERILECKNGVEALEILEKEEVDVVFTDIRMPKMDGITLAAKLNKRENSPMIVVVSGFDDFNYAVEMLKHGVKDYVLKPIKREKIEEILVKLEKELQKKQKKDVGEEELFNQQLTYLLFNQEKQFAENTFLEERFVKYFEQEYVVVVSNQFENSRQHIRKTVVIPNVHSESVMLCPAKGLTELLEGLGHEQASGVSNPHNSFEDFIQAYQEAVRAREEAFVYNQNVLLYNQCEYEKEKTENTEERLCAVEKIPEHFLEKFVQQFPTDKFEDAFKNFSDLYFKARHGKINYRELLILTKKIQLDILEAYPGLSSQSRPLMSYSNALEFLSEFKEWCFRENGILKEKFDTDKNQEKIHHAVLYIHENFRRDLNMAMVSNYVSMNYSTFSIAFKQYTGVNFVNYLKKIRIDEAKRLIEETDDKILSISRQVGYENEKNFMRVFKGICGVSPSEYRKNVNGKS